MKRDKTIAVVVTHNRLVLLQRVIVALNNQNHALDKIIVVNNGSTDGTKEWLDSQQDIMVFHQENVGGSGGFYRGIEEAYKMEADWIWCMDDDVFPEPICLEELFKCTQISNVGILCPKRVMGGKVFISEAKSLNLSNPFVDMHNDNLTKADLDEHGVVEIVGMAFEGPLIKREVVTKIGLPNKDLFILYDDTDYSYRAVLAGYKVIVVSNAELIKYDFRTDASPRDVKMKSKWKLSYHIRNTAYFGHKYGKNIFMRYMAAVPFLIQMYMAITYNFVKGHKYKFSDYVLFWCMMIKGIKEELGRLD